MGECCLLCPKWQFVVAVCSGSLLWQFVVAVCRGSV